MNYHIMLDEKFVTGFIRDAEKVSAPGTNIYYIRGDEKHPKHVNHPLATWVYDIWSDGFREKLNAITENDRLFIHWYDLSLGKLMLTINPNIPLYAVLWGGDFYEDPFLCHADWLYDRKTFAFIRRKYMFPEKWAKNPVRFLQQVWHIINYRKTFRKDFELKKKLFTVSTTYSLIRIVSKWSWLKSSMTLKSFRLCPLTTM